MELQELADRQEIIDLLTRYTVAVDTRSWDDLRGVFTPDAVLDYTPTGGPKDGPDVVIPWIEQGLAGFDRFGSAERLTATRAAPAGISEPPAP